MRKKPWLATLGFIVFTEAVGGLSALLSGGMELYESGIQKPPLSPPGIVFPIVWTILFALLGIGAARIYLAPDSPERTKALRLYPDYMEALVRKGVTLLDLGDDREAQACLNRAVKLQPKSFKARYNRGKCLLKLRYHEEAILDFQQAISAKPKHAAAHAYIAEAYRAVGEEELAQRHQEIADSLRGIA